MSGIRCAQPHECATHGTGAFTCARCGERVCSHCEGGQDSLCDVCWDAAQPDAETDRLRERIGARPGAIDEIDAGVLLLSMRGPLPSRESMERTQQQVEAFRTREAVRQRRLEEARRDMLQRHPGVTVLAFWRRRLSGGWAATVRLPCGGYADWEASAPDRLEPVRFGRRKP